MTEDSMHRTLDAALARNSGPSAEDVEALCVLFHDAYEAAALGAGWETQERSRKPWSEVPEANKVTMRATIRAILASDWLAAHTAAAKREGARAVVEGVRAWCAINEVAAPPLDWEGLGEFLARVEGGA